MAVSRTKQIKRIVKDYEAGAIDPRTALNAIISVLAEPKPNKRITIAEGECPINLKGVGIVIGIRDGDAKPVISIRSDFTHCRGTLHQIAAATAEVIKGCSKAGVAKEITEYASK